MKELRKLLFKIMRSERIDLIEFHCEERGRKPIAWIAFRAFDLLLLPPVVALICLVTPAMEAGVDDHMWEIEARQRRCWTRKSRRLSRACALKRGKCRAAGRVTRRAVRCPPMGRRRLFTALSALSLLLCVAIVGNTIRNRPAATPATPCRPIPRLPIATG